MTPKQEAKRLIKKFLPHAKWWDGYHDQPEIENHAAKCALIAINDRIKTLRELIKIQDSVGHAVGLKVWAENVKEEILKQLETK